MGKRDNKNIDGNGETPNSAASTDTETTATETTGTGKRGRGRPRKSEQREAETEFPRLVVVNEPGDDDDDGPQPQPKKSSSSRKRKNVNAELSKEQITVLIKTTFDIVASRPGLELWKLEQKECELIAEPLAQLLNRNPFISGAASKYGDYIALIVAIATVIVPRAFIQWAAKEKKEKKVTPYVAITKVDGKPGPKESAPSRNEGGTTRNNTEQPSRNLAVSRTNVGQELHHIIPVIQ